MIFGASALYFYNTVNMYGTPSWVGKLEYSSVLPVLEAKSSNQEGSEAEVGLKQKLIFHFRKNTNFIYFWRNFVFTKIFVHLFPFSRTSPNSSIFSKILVKKHQILPHAFVPVLLKFLRKYAKDKKYFSRKLNFFCANLPKTLFQTNIFSKCGPFVSHVVFCLFLKYI